MKKMLERTLALTLALVMALGLMCTGAQAAERRRVEVPAGEEAAELLTTQVRPVQAAPQVVELMGEEETTGKVHKVGNAEEWKAVFDVIASGDTVELTASVATNVALKVPKDTEYTIDLGGNELRITGYGISNKGKVTLKDGTIRTRIESWGEMEINRCTVIADSYVLDLYTSDTTVIDSTIKAIAQSGQAIYTNGGSAAAVSLTNCTVEANLRALNQWGTGTIEANNTTFRTGADQPTLEANYGTVNLENGCEFWAGESLGKLQKGSANVVTDGTLLAARSALLFTSWQDHVKNEYENADRVPGLTVEDDKVTVSNAEGLGWWAGHLSDYAGKTLVLAADIDLGDYLWAPVDLTAKTSLTIDGQNHTISNMIVTGNLYTNGNGTKYYTGFVGRMNGGTQLSISNLIFFDADVSTPGNIVGIVVGVTVENSKLTMENVSVTKSEVAGFGKVGGLVGQSNGTVTLNGCSVTETLINGSYNCAGLVGLKMPMSQLTIENCETDVRWKWRTGERYVCVDGTASHNYIDDKPSGYPGAANETQIYGVYYQIDTVHYAGWGTEYTSYDMYCNVETDTEGNLIDTEVFVGLCYGGYDPDEIHTWGDWTEMEAATCTEHGAEQRECQVCHKTETRDTDALGHKSVIVPGYAATTEHTGRTDGTKCAVCGVTLSVQLSIPRLKPELVDLGDEEVPLAERPFPFIDVKDTDWSREAIAYVYYEGVMEGVSDILFAPGVGLTRASMVTTIYRIEQEPDVSVAALFGDMKLDEWYSEAIAWSVDAQVGKGYDNGLFGVDDICTREQMVTFLYRYAGMKGYNVAAAADLADFTDADAVSAYALDAMKWAVGSGIIEGWDGKLMAGDDVTREQVAAILQRFMEMTETVA